MGVLPGLGPAATIALLLPISMKMGSPVTAIILMSGIFYGAMYGGSTTSILLNLPGEAASVVTCIDGYQMARKGRAGAALGVAAIGSFIAGTVGVIGLTIMAPPARRVRPEVRPARVLLPDGAGLAPGHLPGRGVPLQGLTMAIMGLILGSVGLDPLSGAVRFDFGVPDLQSNIDFVTVAMGLFGVGEILINLEASEAASILTTKIKNVFPTMADLARSGWAMVRGSLIGFAGGHSARAAARSCRRLSPTPWSKRSPSTPRSSGMALSRGSPGPRRPTTPRPRRPSFPS